MFPWKRYLCKSYAIGYPVIKSFSNVIKYWDACVNCDYFSKLQYQEQKKRNLEQTKLQDSHFLKYRVKWTLTPNDTLLGCLTND